MERKDFESYKLGLGLWECLIDYESADKSFDTARKMLDECLKDRKQFFCSSCEKYDNGNCMKAFTKRQYENQLNDRMKRLCQYVEENKYEILKTLGYSYR